MEQQLNNVSVVGRTQVVANMLKLEQRLLDILSEYSAISDTEGHELAKQVISNMINTMINNYLSKQEI